MTSPSPLTELLSRFRQADPSRGHGPDAAFIALCGSEIGKLLDVVERYEKAMNEIATWDLVDCDLQWFPMKRAREALAEANQIAEGKC